MDDTSIYVLKITCVDRAGIVAAISGCIAANGGNILECAQFDDAETGKFLMRVRFRIADTEKLSFHLKPVIEQFDIRHELIAEDSKPRVLIMVSKFDHCLHDLLYRWKKGALNMDLVCVVSNHPDACGLAESNGVAYHHMPITKDTKPEQEAKLLQLIEDERIDLIVLARYMQILSDELSSKLFGKVINIHHSFLPSFKGAKPYHQAHKRGVKLIGATAHYANADLDEGPIIEQEVTRIKHGLSAEDLVRIGEDNESRVLARAVKWHLENRVFLNDSKTVVFD